MKFDECPYNEDNLPASCEMHGREPGLHYCPRCFDDVPAEIRICGVAIPEDELEDGDRDGWLCAAYRHCLKCGHRIDVARKADRVASPSDLLNELTQ